MKILHICLAAFYIDNHSYQENMLPKYHKKLGHDVLILASLQSFDKNGNPSFIDKEAEYINEYGIPVKRIKYKKLPKFLVKKLKIYEDINPWLEMKRPEIIFIHGCQFSNMNDIKRYVNKYPETKIFVDNHCDFSNSATNFISKNILHKIWWRRSAKSIEPYTEKFYGVLPARVEFLKEVYNINPKKIELLVMGGDDEKVNKANTKEIKEKIRRKHNINDEDFLIVTGGKIDYSKKQVLLLIEAVKNINSSKLKLLIFGSITEELKEEVTRNIDGIKIQHIGWIDSYKTYEYFSAANLVVFPGRHSVLWEQTVAQKIPIIAKYWEGTTHIDIGGNCEFIYNDSLDEILNIIKKFLFEEEFYINVLRACKSEKASKFLYSNIAKSILKEEV